MTRIIAGLAKGRSLKVPGKGTRPTSDRAREALFSRLNTWDVIAGQRVLDLFAGSGALGIESLSRGATHVDFVDNSAQAASVIKANLAHSQLLEPSAAGAQPSDLEPSDVASQNPGRSAQVYPMKAGRFLATDGSGPEQLTGAPQWGLVFVDPPYNLSDASLALLLGQLDKHPGLARDALVVVERSIRSGEPAWPGAWQQDGVHEFGEIKIWYAGP